MKKFLKKYAFSIVCLCCFVLFTIEAKIIDVKPVGPLGSEVGFASINMAVRNFIQDTVPVRFQELCYTFTKLAAVLAILTAGFFAVFGLLQLIHRKSLVKVDWEILMLGVVYAATIVLYVLFEKIAINFRPVLEDGVLEPSYPSTHTMIVFCIFGSAVFAFRRYLADKKLLCVTKGFCIAIVVLTVLGRLVSGVHWFSDIIGGMLISLAIVLFYKAAVAKCDAKCGSTSNETPDVQNDKE